MRLLREVPPLVGTLGSSGMEYAAALVLYTLHSLGRSWSESITATELGKTVSEHLDRDPIRSWARNPFLRPDWDELVNRGFAERDDSPEGDVITLTPAALERLAPHLVEADPSTKETP